MTRDAKKILKNALLILFFAFIVFYAFYRSYDLLFGVKIKDVNIIDGYTYHDTTLNITGNAKNAVFLTLNGREISLDKQGNFSETIAPLPGYNVIGIYARDKFEHEDTKYYQIIYEPNIVAPAPQLSEPEPDEAAAQSDEEQENQ